MEVLGRLRPHFFNKEAELSRQKIIWNWQWEETVILRIYDSSSSKYNLLQLRILCLSFNIDEYQNLFKMLENSFKWNIDDRKTHRSNLNEATCTFFFAYSCFRRVGQCSRVEILQPNLRTEETHYVHLYVFEKQLLRFILKHNII